MAPQPGKYGGEDAKYNPPKKTPPPPNRGYTGKPPTTASSPPRSTSSSSNSNKNDGRSYAYGAPTVSPLYQFLQDNHVPYYADAYRDVAADQARNRNQPAPLPMAPTGPGGGGGGGGGGGSTSAADAQKAAAIAAIQTLFQQYGAPADNTLNDQLAKLTGQAQSQGDQAMANLNAMLGTYTNPYGAPAAAPAGGAQGGPQQNAQSQIGDLFNQLISQGATDPQGANARIQGLAPDVQQRLAAMQNAMQGTGQTVVPEGGLPAGAGAGAMGAILQGGGEAWGGIGAPRQGGVSPDLVAMRNGMAGAQPQGQPQQGQQSLVPGVPADYAQAAAGQWNDMLRQSFEAQMMGRRQDAAMSQTSFQQALANNQSAYAYQNSANAKKQKDDLMASILQMAIQNGINLAEIGVSF